MSPGPAAGARQVADAWLRPRAADGDPEALLPAQARTDRWQAVFWWKFAVGADEDLLAAHLLADYYAVLGKDVAARGWHEFLGLLLEDPEPTPPAAKVSPVLPDLVSKLFDSCSSERDCAGLEEHDGLGDVLQAFVTDSSGVVVDEDPVQVVGRLVTSRAGRRRSRARGWLAGLHTGREPSRRRPPSAKDG